MEKCAATNEIFCDVAIPSKMYSFWTTVTLKSWKQKPKLLLL